MKDFALGRYIPVESPLHRLDPRVKIFATLALVVCLFLPFERSVLHEGKDVTVTAWTISAIMLGILLVLALLFFAIARINPLKLWSSMKSLWFTILILMILYILLPNFTVPTLGIAFRVEQMNWTVYWDSFASAGRVIGRLTIVMMFTFLLTATTKPLDLTYALQWYLTPLKIIYAPIAEIFAMTISIALRFIPTLLEDVDRISKAQASRGASYSNGGIRRKIVGLTSLIIPLFVSAFTRSEELAYAMICRGYDPKGKRTRYHKYRFHFGDLFFFLFASAVLALFIVLIVTHFDFIESWFKVSLP